MDVAAFAPLSRPLKGRNLAVDPRPWVIFLTFRPQIAANVVVHPSRMSDLARATNLAPALPSAVAAVREHLATTGTVAIAMTWRTADGEMTIDYRPGDYLRITLTGDAPARTYVLDPDWTP